VRKLTPAEWLAGGAKGFRTLFRSADPFNQPVRNEVEARALLYPVSYLLDEQEFGAVAAAARAEGDTTLVVSITEEFGGSDAANANHWELSYWEYSEYRALDRVGVLENAIYSPAGHWGLLISHEQHAVAAGTRRFIEALLAENPEWQGSCAAFVDDWRHRSTTQRADVSWVPEVLRHIYGSADAWNRGSPPSSPLR